ncbi:hypothetical protein [Granulicoccus sp. GXG6511]|uniref:hypothetical protein n=1 Tax=Granulicoccus sp. GXG6511 TaxID=3381351 RepID=UPI003D7D35FE
MSQAEAEFEDVSLRTRDEYLRFLDRIRTSTNEIEFVLHRTVGNESLPEQVADYVIERREGVGQRPGYMRPARQSTLLRCRYHRDVFTALRGYDGFFRTIPDPPWERTDFSDFGDVDIVIRDKTGAIIFWTVTHEGMAKVRKGF